MINKSEASVLIFAYDREIFLTQALDSVVSQLDGKNNVEVIVSTCFTVSSKIKNEIKYRKIKFVEFPKDIKYGQQFLETFSISTGEIIFVLEDDDLFLPWKTERSLAMFRSSGDIKRIKDKAKVFTNIVNYSYISEELRENAIDFEMKKIENDYCTYKKFSKIHLWSWPISIVFRRDVIEKTGK